MIPGNPYDLIALEAIKTLHQAVERTDSKQQRMWQAIQKRLAALSPSPAAACAPDDSLDLGGTLAEC
ncbi:MAG TPA: hypothetical protein PLQ56_10780 [Aggregatilineales bacterium]|nr:hypothetical protein [Aggregatilineales bacterium]